MRKHIGRKVMAALLAAALMCTALPETAYAVETENQNLSEQEEEASGEQSTQEQAGEEGIGDAWTDNVQSSDGEMETSTEENGEERHTDENSTDVNQTYAQTDVEQSNPEEESASEVLEEEETQTEAEEETEKDIDVRGTETIAQLKQRFPAGKYWNRVNLSYNNPDGVTSTPCPDNHDTAPNTCNNYRGYAQCWGFAYRLAYGYYGSCPLDGWSQSTNAASLDSLKAGDIIRYNGHVVWVTGVDGDEIRIADCNHDYHCGIRWGVTMYKTNIKNTFQSKWSAPYEAVEFPPDPTPHGSLMPTPSGITRVIPDGDYQIISALGSDMDIALDVPGDTYDVPNDTNCQIWKGMIGSKYDVFTLKYNSSTGYYSIIHKGSGKALDLYCGDTARGTNVQYYDNHGENPQQWAISDAGNGFYYIQAKCSGYYLDVAGGSAANGTNVQVWEGNQASCQKWAFVPFAPSTGKTVSEGEYYIVFDSLWADSSNNKVLTVNTSTTTGYPNVEIRSLDNNNTSQIFTVTYYDDGTYCIRNKQTGRNLDIEGCGTMSNVGVWDGDSSGNPNGRWQRWVLKPSSNDDSAYNIVSYFNGKYVTSPEYLWFVTEGTNVQAQEWRSLLDRKQRWKFLPCEKPKLNPPTPSIASGTQVEKGTKLTLSCSGADKIYYTTNGTQPTAQSVQYSTQGITINTDMTLKTFAIKEGYRDSDIVTCIYTVKQSEPSSEKESSSSTESSADKESSSGEETPSDVESGEDKESSSTEESNDTPEGEDPQDGVKWHYNEQKVIYKDLSQYGQIATAIKPKTYDGAPYKPAVKVTAIENGKTVTLTEGTDYRVLYFNNTHAGTGSVIVKGNGVYKGTIIKKFEIKKKPCQKLKVVTNSMLTGENAAPKIYVYDRNILLKENKDYTLDGITPNFTATKGTKQIYVMAASDSDYEGMTTAKITVYDADKGRIKGIIDRPENVKLSQSTYQYTGKACKPTAIVTVDGNTLTVGKDYTIKYRNNKDTGTAFATITGKGSYVGSVVKEFTIKPSNGEFTLKKPISAVTYNGKLQKPKITVTADGKTLKQNKDYTLTYTNNLQATDRAKITVRGKGNYADIPTKIFYFTINPCHMKKASVKGGQGSLLITYAKHTLVEGVDYDVIYGAAAGNGKISVTIKAKEGSSFMGEVTKKIKQ